jgi:hypothetical protein
MESNRDVLWIRLHLEQSIDFCEGLHLCNINQRKLWHISVNALKINASSETCFRTTRELDVRTGQFWTKL